MAREIMERIVLYEGTEPFYGRVIGALDDDYGVLYKLRVPENGLWWVEGEEKDEGAFRTSG